MELPAPEPMRPYRRAYAGGTFDLFHAGHVALFRRIRETVADELVVSLNSDEFAAQYKHRPVMTLEERWAVVEACTYVTQVVLNEGGYDSRPAIVLAGADVVVHGDDWIGGPLCRQMGLSPEWLAERRVALHYLPYTPGVSSSVIRARILQTQKVDA